MKIFTIIPASGLGQRFGSSVPKQLCHIDDEVILEKTHRIFDIEVIHKIYIAVNRVVLDLLLPLKKNFCSKSEFILCGGDNRSDTVKNALKMIANEVGDEDWVIVHDAVRPYLTSSQLSNYIDQTLKTDHGSIMAIPCVDTVKEVNESMQITSTIDRNKIWLAHTPQMFPYNILREALENFPGNPTDESQALEYAGFTPVVIKGPTDNKKITFPEDL
jgi:2-C-methyl-D-erythritol 4-phosphate cytidylyltransferase